MLRAPRSRRAFSVPLATYWVIRLTTPRTTRVRSLTTAEVSHFPAYIQNTRLSTLVVDTAGGAGTTFSGDSGNGTGLGPGKYAYTDESSGPATSGSVYNYGGTIDNAEDSSGYFTDLVERLVVTLILLDAAGGGGVGQTGDAQRILTAFHCIY